MRRQSVGIACARRVNRIDVKLDEKDCGDGIILAVDASGAGSATKKEGWQCYSQEVLYRMIVG